MMKTAILTAFLLLRGQNPATAETADERPKVGYLGADTRGLTLDISAAVDSGAAAGLEATSTVAAIPVGAGAVTRGNTGRICASEQCTKTAAAQTGAEYFVRIGVKRTAPADYALTLDLIRVEPFSVVVTTDDRCEGCVAAKLGRRIELTVSALVSKLVESLEAKPIIRETSEAANSAVPTTSPSKPASLSLDGTPSKTPDRAAGWLPWTAGAVTVAAVGGAVWALAKDGDGSCSLGPLERQCPKVYRTKSLGFGILGLAAVGAGVTAWSVFRWEDDAGRQLAMTPLPEGLLVHGRF